MWSFADQAGLAQPFAAKAVAVLQHFASRFGEYPFADEEVRHGAVRLERAVMEHQTATSVCCWSNLLTAHETAHQGSATRSPAKTSGTSG
jgi:hypothetical protein